MSDKEFWKLIGKHVIRKRNGSIDARPLAKALAKLPPEEILAFDRHMTKHYFESYTWRLWGAAYLIHYGCPDDTFDYFRSWLIGCGRDVFLAAMKNPDSLADVATREAIDDLLYAVGGRTYEKVTGQSEPSSGIRRPKLKKTIDFKGGEVMARTYPRLFAKFAGDMYVPTVHDELLDRCRKIIGAKKKKRLTGDDITGMFQRFRPSGDGLEEVYAGVEHGQAIARRLAAVMQVDGTTKGSTLAANHRLPVSSKEAVALVKSHCEKVHKLAKEMDPGELARQFKATRFVLRAGKRDRYTLNPATEDAIDRLGNGLHNVLYECNSPASELSVGVHRLVGERLLPYYIHWPICAERFKTSEPLEPLFQMWQRGVAWRLAGGGVVEVFAGNKYAPNPYDDLLERCRKYAGAKEQRWSESDVEGFLLRFRPRGKGLAEIYAGVEHGQEIARRLAAAMQVDGTTKSTVLSVNKLTPVTGEQAIAIIKEFCASVRMLAMELNDRELAKRFTATRFVLRAGKRDGYELNDATDEAIEMLRETLCSLFDEAASPAKVLSRAVHSLTGMRLLPYYLQWPICAARIKTHDPLAPVFEMWRRNLGWQLAGDGVVEVFTP